MKKIIELDYKDFFNKKIDSPLRKVANPVINFNEILLDIEDLKKAFYSLKISVGLAAPQIGINKRICIVNLNKEKNEDLIFINPIIISNTGKAKTSNESCLSLPQYQGLVTRKDKLKIEYQDVSGSYKSLSTRGFLARVILHEIDHLEGILYVDKMDNPNQLEKINFEWK